MTTKPKARRYRIHSSSQANDLTLPDDTPDQDAAKAAPGTPQASAAETSGQSTNVPQNESRPPDAPTDPQSAETTPDSVSETAPASKPETAPVAEPQDPPGAETPAPPEGRAADRPAPAQESEAAEADQMEQLARHAAASKAMREAQASEARTAPPTRPEGGSGAKAAPQSASEATSEKPASPEGPAQSGEPSAAETPERIEAALEEIRREGLTGRQLRMARRNALKNGLQPSSDFDAVRLLRDRGIDPFQSASVPQTANTTIPAARPQGDQVPQTAQSGALSTATAGGDKPPRSPLTPSERRQREIMDIQRDIARRRRRRTFQLFMRLSFFVLLPTLLAGWYYYRVATPMYSTESEFLILQADATGGAGALSGLLTGTQFATNQDSIAVQSYLQSKDAMLRLDQDAGFKSEFSQPSIDPIQRLPENPTNEQAYKFYEKYVKIGYDPTEGVIQMEVIAPDPAVATEYSNHLITYAEERIDELSRRKREDAVSAARESLEQAKQDRREAQERLVRLQEGTFVDPEGVIGTLRSQISTVEMELNDKELELAALEDNARPNEARVAGVKADIQRLQDLQVSLNARMNDAQNDDVSLAEKAAQIQMAQADVATADMFLQSALQNEKQTELEANRQVRYLTTLVRPVPSEDPSYPKAFENTMMVFLIMSGLYLMVSLTGAILREQVSN